MAGSDDDGTSEPLEQESEAEGEAGGAGEGPPAWWRPKPPQEAAPDPALVEAAEAVRRADVLLLVAGEAPPEAGVQALNRLANQVPVFSCLMVPVKGQWVNRGWLGDKIVELQSPEMPADALELAFGFFKAYITLFCRNARLKVVCLDIAGSEAPALLLKELGSLLGDVPGSAWVTIGADADKVEPSCGAAQHLRVALDLQAALEWWGRDAARVELASFLVFDGMPESGWVHLTHKLGHGAEVQMPRDASVLQIYRKVCAEFGEEGNVLMMAEPSLVAVAIYNPTVQMVLEPGSTVPWQFFSPTGDSMPLVAKLYVPSGGTIRFPCRNARMLERRQAVLGILEEMVRKFRSEDYQTQLALVQDQIELRAMVKAVHLTVLPKYGFPLTEQTRFDEAMRMQTRMQMYLYSGIFEPEDDYLGNQSLELSGISKLPTLPFRYRPKPTQALMRSLPVGAVLFKPCETMAHQQTLFGGWFGWRRVPTFFVSASADDMAEYLRSDPEGPFAGQLDDWPDKGKPLPEHTRWHRWGFTEDAKETVLKTDWHALPRFEDTAELFVPRRARRDAVGGAPPRFLAFAEAFRAANRGCWTKLAEALQSLKTTHERSGSKIWKEREGSSLVDEVITSFQSHGLFGIIEAQVWWGDGPLVLPSHKDGATSLLHLSLTLGGARTVRLGLFRSMLAGGVPAQEDQWWVKEPDDPEAGKVNEDVWDNVSWQSSLAGGFGYLEDMRMARGSCYLSSPYCFEHGVRYENGSKDDPVIALQCRFAFEPLLGKKLNGRRDSAMWEISNAISKTIRAAAERGELRMPTVEEVRQTRERLVSMRGSGAAEVPATTGFGPALGAAPAPAAAPSPTVASPAAAAQLQLAAAAAPKEPELDAEKERERQAREQDWKRDKDLAKRDKAFKEAAKERERVREKARLERARGDDAIAACMATDDSCAEEVQVTIRQGQKGGQVVVTVPAYATMLEVKKALVQKIGRGLVRKVQLVKERGKTFEAYNDQERLCGRTELVMLGLNLMTEDVGTQAKTGTQAKAGVQANAGAQAKAGVG